MKTLFPALSAAARAHEPVALGIITGVQGSSPQKLGAKALFYSDRKILGTVGGGCLEAEVQRLALQSLRDDKPRTFELVLDHDFGWDDGLICGGKVSGVIIPNAQNLGATFWDALTQRDEPKTWGVKSNFTIARHVPSSHSLHGPERLLSRPSATLSSIRNGGEGRGEEALTSSELQSANLNLANSPHSTQVSTDWLYTETIAPPCALWIAGSGHLAQAVAPLALQLDFAVRIFDDRPELANHELFPGDVSLHVGHWGDILNQPFAVTPTFGLIVTRGHNMTHWCWKRGFIGRFNFWG